MFARRQTDEERQADPAWAFALFAALLPVGLLFLQGQRLDGDSYHYIEYWHKLVQGIQHTSSLHEAAPKPIPILLFGLAYDASSSFFFLSLLFIAVGAVAVAWIGCCVQRVWGPAQARAAVLLVSIHPLFIEGVLGGSSAVLEVFFLSGALLAFMSASRSALLCSGGLLLAAGLCRPDIWPLPYLALMVVLVRPTVLGASKRGRLAFAGLALAPAIWLAFDAALTGDPLFSFRDTVDYGSRHLATVAHPAIVEAVFAYARRLVTTLLGAIPGPGLLLGVVGLVVAWGRRPLLAVTLSMAALSVASFYFLPFRSGLPLLPRFLLIPVVVVNVFAGVGLIALWEQLESALAGKSRKQSALALVALAGVASLHSIDGLRRWSTGTGRFHAETTSDFSRVASWLAEREGGLQDRVLVPARRKGLAVLLMGLRSDQVSSYERQDPGDPALLRERFDLLLYQSDDLDESYSSSWAFLAAPPPGFVDLHPPLASSAIRVYVRAELAEDTPSQSP